MDPTAPIPSSEVRFTNTLAELSNDTLMMMRHACAIFSPPNCNENLSSQPESQSIIMPPLTFTDSTKYTTSLLKPKVIPPIQKALSILKPKVVVPPLEKSLSILKPRVIIPPLIEKSFKISNPNVTVPPPIQNPIKLVSLLKRPAGGDTLHDPPLMKKSLVDYPLTDESEMSEMEEDSVNLPASPVSPPRQVGGGRVEAFTSQAGPSRAYTPDHTHVPPPLTPRKIFLGSDDDSDDDGLQYLEKDNNIIEYRKSLINNHEGNYDTDDDDDTMDSNVNHTMDSNDDINNHTIDSNVDDNIIPYLIETAFQCRLETWRLPPHGECKDIPNFLKTAKRHLESCIRDALTRHDALKVNLRLECQFKRGEDRRTFLFKTKNVLITRGRSITMLLEALFTSILSEIDDLTHKGSGWVLLSISFIELCLNLCDILKGSSYIDLPSYIKTKRACINIKNRRDEKCFAWSILAWLHPVNDNPHRLSHYRKYLDNVDEKKNELKFGNLKFPIALTDISKFERMNEISVNVIGVNDDKKFFPLYMNTDIIHPRSVDLLFFKDDQNEKGHYVLIKDLSRLLRSQFTKFEHHTFICRNCLGHYVREDLLKKHQLFCLFNKTARIMLPNDSQNILEFKEYERCHKVPFVIYADFECLLEKSTDPNILHKHIPSSYAYYIKNSFRDKDEFKDNPKFEEKLVMFRGKDAHKHFVRKIYKDAKRIHKKFFKNIIPLIKTEQTEFNFLSARQCYLCKKEFDDKITPVRDHCHITGKYRGALCNKCNLRFELPKFIPVIFHNYSRYDSHLFVKALASPEFPGALSVIPQTEETYISLSKEVPCKDGKKVILRFLDSYRFLSSSLASLAERLEPEQFKVTIQNFPKETPHSLILRKGVFPYQYIDHMDRYLERQLPPPDEFYSDLSDACISDAEYQHAQLVWTKFNLQTLGEYSDLYLKCDVLILADIFEQFRRTCKKHYKLDPAHFFTAPGISWSAMLKFTKVRLQLLQDYDMIMFIERGIRGGISQVCHRHAKANNKYMTTDYDPEKDPAYLMYFDINNLYGWSMEQPLPLNDFKWLSPEEITKLNIATHKDDDPTGYILEVDLEYPDKLHKDHNEFPLAPHKECVEKKWLSDYLGKNYKPSRVKKLLTTLHSKEKYVIHYKTLKLYVDLGLKVTKIHRCVSFHQRPWLEPYIKLNTNLRKEATDDFGRDLYKLMNNSVFGKTMESVRNRQNIVLCEKWETLRFQIAKASFKSTTIFDENLAAAHLYRERVLFDKPIYVGMAILDLSKFKIYDFHYNIMVPKYQNNLKVLYHDTDSFMYQIHTKDMYHDMADPIFGKNFDTSNYPIDNPYELPLGQNRLALGFMKDENKGKIMLEFIGLRSKMYCIKVQGEESVTKKIKGITKAVIKNKITFEDFKACLSEGIVKHEKVVTIRSNSHELFTLKTSKKALCPLDDKKFILEDGIHCLSYGHYILRPKIP